MRNTKKHDFKVFVDLLEENAKESLQEFSDNFEKIDKLIPEKRFDISRLNSGDTYANSEIIYNSNPTTGGYVGWINIQEGKFAPKWEENKDYNLGDIVSPKTYNGHIYECIQSGRSSESEPNFPLSSEEIIKDLRMSTTWKSEYNYSVNDIVTATNGDQTFYYKCIVSGISDQFEPPWANVSGVTNIDGSVTWLNLKTVKWKESGLSCNFRPFGKIE